MDTLSIISAIAAFAAIGGLAWLGGYEIGQANAQPRRPTVAELVNELKPRRPKAAKNRRKAARKAVRA
jgi:hypothetical protein